MPFHAIPHKGGGFDVENADTHEVKNKEPFASQPRAAAYARALNAHSGDVAGKGMNGKQMDHAQAIHDHANELGAACGATKHGAVHGVKESDQLQAIHDHAVALGAECVEEMGEGMGDNPEEEAAEEQKAISKREDVNPKEGTHKYGNVTFADEKNKKYPIDTEEHIRAAWNYINKEGNAGKYDPDEVATIKRKIVAAWKEKIDKEGPPSEQKKSLDFSYAKALGIAIPELAVKYVGRDEIKGYTFLWGGPAITDVEREYFTKSTDFWDGLLGKNPRPLTWDHAQDQDFKAAPVIGQVTDFGDDDLGRWYTAKMDRSHKYRKMIDKLIEEGVLGTSSDSAPQYVERERTGKATWLKTWPWFASALTDVPCEPRMIGSIEVLKSLGVTLPDESVFQARQREQALRLKAQRLNVSIALQHPQGEQP